MRDSSIICIYMGYAKFRSQSSAEYDRCYWSCWLIVLFTSISTLSQNSNERFSWCDPFDMWTYNSKNIISVKADLFM